MKNTPLFLKIFSIYSLTILIFVLFQPIGSTQALENASTIDLSTSHERVMDIENFKPGDYAVRTLTLDNNGTSDLHYKMTSSLKSGSEKLYNQLHLTLSIGNSNVFSGPLSDFEGMEARALNAQSSDELSLRVEFPYESGNEYQGLATEVIFQFVAEGDITPGAGSDSDNGGTPESPNVQPVSSGGGLLPQTGEGSPYLYYIIGGLLLAAGTSLYVKSIIVKKRKMAGAES
ncbi:TasA family protein [Halobacillus litoralis]|uniref:TasA family protein n=1 Tax=Halobacillus litoralis TaxID=45668 RepID=UPI002491E4F0|nr:TasA family protein [Halobacillus litoralis]